MTTTFNHHKTHVIDADRHVSEPLSIWQDYLPKKYHDYLPHCKKPMLSKAALDRAKKLGLETEQILPEIWVGTHCPLFSHWNDILHIEASYHSTQCAGLVNQASHPDKQIHSMNRSGIQQAFLFPTLGTYFANHEHLPREVTTAYMHAYNDYIKDYCKDYPNRLFGVALLSKNDPKSMLLELKRIAQIGFRCITIRPEKAFNKTISHRDYDMFWDSCQALDIPIAIHGGTHLQADTIGCNRYTSRFALHACSHPLEAQLAFLSMLEAGIFHRFNKIKIAFLESGASWIPHWLWRLDTLCYNKLPGEVADRVKMKPSDYFRRHCYIGFEPDEPCLRAVVKAIGSDRLLLGSDFPHPDHDDVFNIHSILKKSTDLSIDEVKKALHENAQHFFF